MTGGRGSIFASSSVPSLKVRNVGIRQTGSQVSDNIHFSQLCAIMEIESVLFLSASHLTLDFFTVQASSGNTLLKWGGCLVQFLTLV